MNKTNERLLRALRDAAINIRNIFLVAGVLLLVCGFLLIAVIKRMRRTAV